MAEENGLIDALSWIVLEGVCRLLGSGTVPERKTVSINLSMQQFLRKDLTERIEDMLRKYGVAPERLKLEITERVLADNSQLARQTMEKVSRRHRPTIRLRSSLTASKGTPSTLEKLE